MTRVLDNDGATIQLCPSYQVTLPMTDISVENMTVMMREMNVVKSCVEIIKGN